MRVHQYHCLHAANDAATFEAALEADESCEGVVAAFVVAAVIGFVAFGGGGGVLHHTAARGTELDLNWRHKNKLVSLIWGKG